jgi:hypothetical protein
MENIIVTTSKMNLRGSSMTCAAGLIEFSEEGVAEMTLEQADLLRSVKHLSFSDQPEKEIAEDAVIEEEKELLVEQDVLETQRMPMDFGMPEGLEMEVTEEEVDESNVPAEKEDDTDVLEESENPLVAQLNELNVSDLKDLCEAGEAEGYKSMKKAELVNFIIKNDLIK